MNPSPEAVAALQAICCPWVIALPDPSCSELDAPASPLPPSQTDPARSER